MLRQRNLTLLGMVFLSAMPDAMVVPVLRMLLVDRYHISVGAAHLFICINLLGAMACAGLINHIQRRWGNRKLLATAALMNAMLLAVMAAPLGFSVDAAGAPVRGRCRSCSVRRAVSRDRRHWVA